MECRLKAGLQTPFWITMNKIIDILGLGYTAVDDLLYVDAYPAADSKALVRRRDRQCGGLTATALVAAARLGCRCSYAGTLGDDEHSQFVEQRFGEEGIDTTRLRRKAGAGPVLSTIIVDQIRLTRTIFSDLAGMVGPDSTWPPEALIRAAKVLLVDHCGVEGMVRAARIAREAEMPVVADLEDTDDRMLPKLIDLANHLILPRGFALRLTGEKDPASAVRALWKSNRSAAVVTCGGEGSWFISGQEPGSVRHQPAMSVEVVDTTGCGDVFHGAYAAALVRGMDVSDAVRFATVTAGLKATRRGGQAGIPNLLEVETRMQQVPAPFGRGDLFAKAQ
jgi:sulfofructose kinase